MEPPHKAGGETSALLARLRAFCFPGGEDTARLVLSLKTTERGEMRASPSARWIPFTAEQVIDTRRSSFRWEARYQGGMSGWISVTEGYEEGRGRLVVKLGGVVAVQKVLAGGRQGRAAALPCLDRPVPGNRAEPRLVGLVSDRPAHFAGAGSGGPWGRHGRFGDQRRGVPAGLPCGSATSGGETNGPYSMVSGRK